MRSGTLVRVTAGLLAIAVLSGCAAQQARTTGAWSAGAAHDQSFQRILVIGVTPDLSQRCAFEGFLVAEIRTEATSAITSCNALEKGAPLTRENVERAVAAHQVDAVIATTLVAQSGKVATGGTSETRGDAYYKAVDVGYDYYGFYGAYGVPVVYGEFETAEPLTIIKGNATIVTRLYETSGATMIYEMETRGKDLESRVAAMAILSDSIAARLRKQGLID
jgi:hypothetical protein